MLDQEIATLILDAIRAMTLIEVFAVFFSLTYVILATRRNVWCWPAGLIGAALYLYLCFIAKLYVETWLQVFYIIMAIYGWVQWHRPVQNNETETIQIKTWSLKLHLGVIGIGIALAASVGYFFVNYSDAALPYIDAFTTIFSFIATWMVANKVLENWLYWVVIDLVSIFLYASRDYYLTSLLFFAYTIIAIIGYIQWKKAYQVKQTLA